MDRTANIPLTAKRLAFGKLLNAGQTCVAPDYCLVDRKVRDELVEELKKQFQRMLGQDPLANDHFVRIINRKHYNRLQGLLEGGGDPVRRRPPGRPRLGQRMDCPPPWWRIPWTGLPSPWGRRFSGPFCPSSPMTVWTRPSTSSTAGEKPLALYLFTRSQRIKERILRSCSFGGGCINDTIIHLATHHMGFGGVGQSGMGSYHGKRSFDTFSHYRAIVDKATWLDLPMRYHPL